MKTHCVNGHELTPENIVYARRQKGQPKRRKCRTCLNESKKRYRERLKEHFREKGRICDKAFYKRNKGKIYSATQEYRRKWRDVVLDHYGAKCNCCGETIREFLCVDHVNNNGSEHRKELKEKGQVNIFHWLVKNNFPDGFQLLCHNCNFTKFRYGMCPHQKTTDYVK